MSDVKCPYCDECNEINHDDGYGYEEYKYYEQHCCHCDKAFNFTTSIIFHYEAFCLNNDHEFKPDPKIRIIGGRPHKYKECLKCDYSEWVEVL
jgi:hypothetical protein